MRRLPWLAIAVIGGLLAASFSLTWPVLLAGSEPWIMTAVVFGTCGALIITRRPAHPIGWLFMGNGLLSSAGFLLLALGERVLELPGAAWAEAIGNAVTTMGVSLIPASMLRFPDGRLLSTSWRWAARLVVAMATLGALASLLNGGWGGDIEQAIHPSPVRDVTMPFGDVLSTLFYALMVAAMAAAGLSLILRFRRARGIAREQMKWLAAAGALLVVSLVASFLEEGAAELSNPIFTWVVAVSFAGIPVAVAIAILRYRLYDIDRIINRTIVYGLATTAVLAVYGAIVFTASTLAAGTNNNLIVALATLAAAAVFRPALRRMQAFVDRRFYRRRFDVQTTMDRFGVQLNAGVNLDELTHDLVGVVRSTMQPEQVGVWLRGAG